MEKIDIKEIWKSSREQEQQTKKYSMEAIHHYVSQRSRRTSSSVRWSIFLDIALKGFVLIGLVYLAQIQVLQYPFQVVVWSLFAATLLLIVVEFMFIKKLSSIRDTDAVLQNLSSKLNYLQTTQKRFILFSALSSPLLVLCGFLLYYYLKYNSILLESPVKDPVPYIILAIAFAISYVAQSIQNNQQITDLKEMLEDVHDETKASGKISAMKASQKKRIIVFTILALLGLLVLLFFLSNWFIA
ncbi:hypothetical protein [Pontibacter cellulosilyticus]|uniref:Uncharacterized protein n=1 Tax=Pontibacter cellulosilyticus TaxID=1720253 RepID=A0A923NDQ1_9BACT|nr:hypothetical protein [Pontibacter cellulosilyticus]MBC5995045.1 hypothetical protein [Pontibacter cellulosilyticus]